MATIRNLSIIRNVRSYDPTISTSLILIQITMLQVALRKEKDDAEEILSQCLDFCSRFVEAGHFSYACGVLQFIHRANENDSWLLSSAEVVLPSLFRLFSNILLKADAGFDTEQKEIVFSLSPNVKNNRTALRALSVALDLSVDLSDTEAPDIEDQLEKFIRASAAILFDSHYSAKKSGENLNSIVYAMDELVRHASFALSNILLSYRNLLPTVESFLIDRIYNLFDFLGSAAELSVQRSLIIVLKVMYDHVCGVSEESSARCLIEDKFNTSKEWGHNTWPLFKDLNVANGIDVVAKDELMIRISMNNDLRSKPFTTTGCKVQVKGLTQGKRSAFKNASVDWNLTSIAIHFASDTSLYWPLYTLGKVEWRRSNQNLFAKFDSWEDQTGAEIVFRFEGEEDAIKREIYERLQEALTRTITNPYSSLNGLNQEKSQVRMSVSVENMKPSNTVQMSNCSEGSTLSDKVENDSTKKKYSSENIDFQFDDEDIEEDRRGFGQLETVDPELIFPEIDECFGSGRKTNKNCLEERTGLVKRNRENMYGWKDKASFRKEISENPQVRARALDSAQGDGTQDKKNTEVKEDSTGANHSDEEANQTANEHETAEENESSESEHDSDATYSPEIDAAREIGKGRRTCALKKMKEVHDAKKVEECNGTDAYLIETEARGEHKMTSIRKTASQRSKVSSENEESEADSEMGHISDVEMDAKDIEPIGGIDASEIYDLSSEEHKDEGEDRRESDERTELFQYQDDDESIDGGDTGSPDEKADFTGVVEESVGKCTSKMREQTNRKEDVNNQNGEMLWEYQETVEIVAQLMMELNQVRYICSPHTTFCCGCLP